MADFTSFGSLARAFQTGYQALGGKGSPGATYSLRTPHVGVQRALNAAGEAYLRHFQEKVLNAGPGWPSLADSTVAGRVRMGQGSPSDPLFYTGQMFEALMYKVEGTDLHVGIKDGEHLSPRPGGEPVEMEDLFMYHELGTRNMPPRPIFTADDFESANNAIVEAFAEQALVNGYLKKLMR